MRPSSAEISPCGDGRPEKCSCQQEPCSGALLNWELMAFSWQKMTKAMSRSEDVAAVFEHCGAECQAALVGRIAIDSSPDLRETLLEQLSLPSCGTLTIDFSEVAYLDTSGLAILVEILKAARTHGKEFQLDGLKRRPRYLLETARLLRFFHEANSEAVQKSESPGRPQQPQLPPSTLQPASLGIRDLPLSVLARTTRCPQSWAAWSRSPFSGFAPITAIPRANRRRSRQKDPPFV